MDGNINMFNSHSHGIHVSLLIVSFRPISITEKVVMESQLFSDVNMESKYEDIERSFALTLLQSNFDSIGGISVSVDMPFGVSGLMNISCHAVLRTYYGMNYRIISPNIWERYSYGSTLTSGTLGMDPRKYSTKAMSAEMNDFGMGLQQYLLKITVPMNSLTNF